MQCIWQNSVKSGCQGVGGFIGSMGENAQITYSGATVAVTAPKERSTNAGGFIGRGNGERDAWAIVKNCYSKGAVTGGAYAGGFTGSMAGMDIQNCYATGNVTDAIVEMTSFAGTNSVALILMESHEIAMQQALPTQERRLSLRNCNCKK